MTVKRGYKIVLVLELYIYYMYIYIYIYNKYFPNAARPPDWKNCSGKTAERLASLGIMGGIEGSSGTTRTSYHYRIEGSFNCVPLNTIVRAPLNPPLHHSTIVLRVPSIGPPLKR